ncbi:hypothetical protein EJ07DRAFT_155234 [Lizonia empirigonia]|nr:hypothetical protein EJ07DRAFT_155234 [Lizonia empirigonia]
MPHTPQAATNPSIVALSPGSYVPSLFGFVAAAQSANFVPSTSTLWNRSSNKRKPRTSTVKRILSRISSDLDLGDAAIAATSVPTRRTCDTPIWNRRVCFFFPACRTLSQPQVGHNLLCALLSFGASPAVAPLNGLTRSERVVNSPSFIVFSSGPDSRNAESPDTSRGGQSSPPYKARTVRPTLVTENTLNCPNGVDAFYALTFPQCPTRRRQPLSLLVVA